MCQIRPGGGFVPLHGNDATYAKHADPFGHLCGTFGFPWFRIQGDHHQLSHPFGHGQLGHFALGQLKVAFQKGRARGWFNRGKGMTRKASDQAQGQTQNGQFQTVSHSRCPE